MREVANFMHMYPAYKLRDVIEEYAISFFALLNEGYRIKFRHYRMLGTLNELPNAERRDKDRFYKQLEYAAAAPNDILKPESKGSSDEEIRRALGG